MNKRALVTLLCSGFLSGSIANAEPDCTALTQLRKSADVSFRDIRSLPKEDEDSTFDVSYSMEGGKCELEGKEGDRNFTYRCQWFVGRDQGAAKEAYTVMLASTLVCLRRAPEPAVQSESGRGESTRIFDDSSSPTESRKVSVGYGYRSRWWYVEFAYESFKRK